MNDNISLEIEELEDELDDLNKILSSNNKKKLLKKIANIVITGFNILFLLGFYGKMPASYLILVTATLTSVMEIGTVCICGSSIENKKEKERIINNINEKNNELLQVKDNFTKSRKKTINTKKIIRDTNSYNSFNIIYEDSDEPQITNNFEAKILKKTNKTPRN